YVGSELRGKQEVIINGGVAWVNAQVNAAGGEETISFKVYDASAGVTHENSNTSAVITTGGAVGSFASPLMIEMKDPNGDPNGGGGDSNGGSGKGQWIEEGLDTETGLRTGTFEISNNYPNQPQGDLVSHQIEPNAALSGAIMVEASLQMANLGGANLAEAILVEANLEGANLEGADLTRADLGGANLRGANLAGAIFIDANLGGANLEGANLAGANIDAANFSGANLSGVNSGSISGTPQSLPNGWILENGELDESGDGDGDPNNGGNNNKELLYSQNFEDGDGGFIQSTEGTNPVDANYNRERKTWQFPGNDAGPSTNYLTSSEITITQNTDIEILLNHRFSIEALWDGAAVEYSINGGEFQRLEKEDFFDNGYNFEEIQGQHALRNKSAFSADSGGYDNNEFITSSARVNGLSENSKLKIRLLAAWDDQTKSPNTPNWEINFLEVRIAGNDFQNQDGSPPQFFEGTFAITSKNGNFIKVFLEVQDDDGRSGNNFSITSPPAQGQASIDADSGEWSYKPDEGFAGEDFFTVNFKDDLGNSTPIEIRIKVEDDGQGAPGPASLVNVETDTTNSTLKKDSGNGSIYFVKGAPIDGLNDYFGTRSNHFVVDNEKLIRIVDDGGNPVDNLDQNYSWSEGNYSESVNQSLVAIEQMDNGSYKLAIKKEGVRGEQGNTENFTDWVLHTISSGGVIDWEGQYLSSIVTSEAIFRQDLNGDGVIGFNTASLTPVTTDTSGALLKKDSEGNIWIIDGETNLLVLDEGENPARLEHSSSYPGGSSIHVVFAVKSTETGYQLVKKMNDTYTIQGTNQQETNESYEVFSLNASGILSFENVRFIESLISLETEFDQDFNNDSVIGFNISSLESIDSDTSGATLKKDSDGNLWIIDGVATYQVKDSYGGIPRLTFSETFPEGKHTSDAVAVEKQNDGSYRLAVRITDSYNSSQSDINGGGS
ncbi:pentapeptide repeat-containing protein, partial [Verrucomicrobia bacterium]|nr:pentapeptide repeat-containing protein [Verrucomicrobiota bacterium]